MGWVGRFLDDPIGAITDNKITDHPLESAALGAGLFFGLPAMTGMGWGEMGAGLGSLFSPTAEAVGTGLADAGTTAVGSGAVEGAASSAFPLAGDAASGVGSALGASEAAMTPAATDLGAGLSGTTAASMEAPTMGSLGSGTFGMGMPTDVGMGGMSVGTGGGLSFPEMSPGTLGSGTYGMTMPTTAEVGVGDGAAGGLGGMWDQAKDIYNTYGKPLQGGLMIANGLQSLYQNKQNQGMYRQNMNTIGNMYQPGSPEALLMQQEMERKDAAAGRRSQYGTRQTELAARLAQARMQALSSGGYQQSMQGAAQSGLGSYAGISAGLGQMFGSK